MSFLTSEPGDDEIVVETHFPVPPERVFQAWTNPGIVRQWFGPKPGALAAATIDLQPGGHWRFSERIDRHGSKGFEGEYLEIVADGLLVFTWRKFVDYPTGTTEATAYSKVEISFTATDGGTDMRIVHSELDEENRVGFQVGWSNGMANLGAVLDI